MAVTGLALLAVATGNFFFRRMFGKYGYSVVRGNREYRKRDEDRWIRANLPFSVLCWVSGGILLIAGVVSG